MSLECGFCERDARSGHDADCPRGMHPVDIIKRLNKYHIEGWPLLMRGVIEVKVGYQIKTFRVENIVEFNRQLLEWLILEKVQPKVSPCDKCGFVDGTVCAHGGHVNVPFQDHEYVTHHTYTGAGCARCGGAEREHPNGKR